MISGCFLHALFIVLVFARFVPGLPIVHLGRCLLEHVFNLCPRSVIGAMGVSAMLSRVARIYLHRVLHDAHEMLNFFSDVSAFRIKDGTVANHAILNDTVGRNNDTHAQHE